MATDCIAQVTFKFEGVGKPVVARFDTPHAEAGAQYGYECYVLSGFHAVGRAQRSLNDRFFKSLRDLFKMLVSFAPYGDGCQ